MSFPRSGCRRTAAIALLAAGVAVHGSLPGAADVETLAGGAAAVPVPAGPGVQPVAGPASRPPAPAPTSAEPALAAPAPLALPAQTPPAHTPPTHTPSARTRAGQVVDDGLTGPAEAVLEGVPAAEVEPLRVVAQTTDASGRPDWQVFEADTRAEALAAVEAARAVPDVDLVTVDREVHAFAEPVRYDDRYRSYQWALDTLRGEAAAAAASGAGVTVAVLDTGVRGDHEDVAAGSVLVGRSYVSDSYGSAGNVDPNGHGTHVAGIIAAARNNARGVAGLSAATILPMRVLGTNGSGSSYGIATAIRDAVDMGADVVSMSLGGPNGEGVYDSVVSYARSKGVVVVAAAGNSRQDGDPVHYPAATPGVLTVASSNAAGTTSSFSSTGTHVEVAAPGERIVSLGHGSATSYVGMSGTSMATPYVAAAAAMLLGARPDLTPAQVETALVATARDIEAPGRDVQAGAGVIDPLAALQSLGAPTQPAPTQPAPAQPAPAEPAPNRAPVAARDVARATQGATVTVDVRANDSDPDGDAVVVTAVGRPARGTATLSGGTVRYTAPSGWTGTDAFTYTLSDGRGGTATGRVTVTVATRPNRAPAAGADAVTLRQGGSARIAVLANDRDADGDRLTLRAVGPATSGSTRVWSGTVLYRPKAGFSGVDSFTYRVSDGKGGTATGSVTVTVQAVNRPPRATTDRGTTARGVPVSIAVLANDRDPDGDGLTVTSLGRARRGTVTAVDGSVVYTPVGRLTGTDSFTYRLSDGRGGVATGLVTVRVAAPATTRR